MVCIYCSSPTRVNNSRKQSRTNNIWRRRECLTCASIFTTLEYPQLDTAILVESAGKLVPFSRDKLFISMYKVCGHRDEPIADASHLTQTILTKILANRRQAAVPRDQIISIAGIVLKRFDAAAATMYAAYHRL